MSLISIVDEDDNIIDYVERDLRRDDQRYRVSGLWITNRAWEILIAQRHKNKKHYPLLWWPAVAGTVEKGETYQENIIKEAEEELGIKDIRPILWPKTETTSRYIHFTQWFLLTIDRELDEFILQEDEVESLKWISSESLRKEYAESPDNFVPSFALILPLFL